MKKLWDIPRNTRIDVSHLDLVDERTGDKVKVLTFSNLDFPYARCFTLEGDYYLLYASTEIKVL